MMHGWFLATLCLVWLAAASGFIPTRLSPPAYLLSNNLNYEFKMSKFKFNDDVDESLLNRLESRSKYAQLLGPSVVGILISALFLTSTMSPISNAVVPLDSFNPSTFQPVCPASDRVYQILKATANSLVGADNVAEYGPLIASVLLRVRLELCVLESFVYEAIIPFVKQKGLSWILPLHETVETFLAGTIFAVASNFILLGSTKIISVLFIYLDALTGLPARWIGKGLKSTQIAAMKNTGIDFAATILKGYGDVLGALRSLIEKIDTFVGRYLVIATTLYIAFKFIHFKIFPFP